MRYKGTIVIEEKIAEKIKHYTDVEPKTEGECFLGDPIVYTYRFINGMEADIKCCSVASYEEGGCNTAWTEGILFDERGHEICVTECGESYEGVWYLTDDHGNEYEVTIVRQSKHLLETAYELYKLDWMMVHGIYLTDIINHLKEAVEICTGVEPVTLNGQAYESAKLISDAMENVEEVGFKHGCLWTCIEEFRDEEFQDTAYVLRLLLKAGAYEEAQYLKDTRGIV